MEGVLYKYKNMMTGWKKRYFILKDNILYYYKNKGEKVKGRIHMLVATLKEVNDKKNKQFEIHSGLTVFKLKAETKELRDQWINTLRVVKFVSEKNENNNHLNTLNTSSNKISNENKEFLNVQKKLAELQLYTGNLEVYNEKVIELLNKSGSSKISDIKSICESNKVII